MMKDGDECGVVGGMLGRGNHCVWRKPSTVPLCPLQIPHDLTWATMVGSQQLTISKAIEYCFIYKKFIPCGEF
jgi:hypothetical protein